MVKVVFIASLTLFSIPAWSESVPAITFTTTIGAYPTYTGMFDFAAWGYTNFPYVGDYQGTTPTKFSYSWDQTFELPASPGGDYFEVTRINTFGLGPSAIVIDGQSFNGVIDGGPQLLQRSPAPFPDPNFYKVEGYGKRFVYTERMDLSGPISIHVYGSFATEYNTYDCCDLTQEKIATVGNGFEQFLQIERFHADGTPDPFAPEPASFGLVGLALLPVGWMLRRRSRSPRGSLADGPSSAQACLSGYSL